MTILQWLARLFALWTVVFFVSFLACAAEKSAEELLMQAGVSFARSQREDAIELATKAIEAEPKNAKAHYVRGRFYAQVRQTQKAVKDFDQALALDPAAGPAYYYRAMENFKLGRIKESAADFDKSVDLTPDQA